MRRVDVGFASGKPVHFVHDQDLRNGRGADFAEHLEDVGSVLDGGRRGNIDYMQDQGGLGDFFEGRAEGLHQGGGQVADEADSIAHQDAPFRGKHERPHGGIECGEHARVHQHSRLGEAVEERGLASIGVTGQRQGGERYGATAAAMEGTAGPDTFQVVGDFLNALLDATAVGLKLRFARAAGADAAAEARHFDAATGEARQPVVQLREFHLQAAFASVGAGGEDVEDELGAVDDFRLDGLFEIALLGRGEVVIEDHHVGLGG